MTIVPWSAHSTRDGCRISCSLGVYAKFSFLPLVILLFLIIVVQIYLAAGIHCQHPGMSFFHISAILDCSLFQSPWIFSVVGLLLNSVFFAFSSVDSSSAQDLKKTRWAAYAAGTRKNHKTQWKAYLSFCLYFDLRAYLPALLDTVCLYCQFLSRSLTPQSVRNYLSSVNFTLLAVSSCI